MESKYIIEERRTLFTMTPLPVELIFAVHHYSNFCITLVRRKESTSLAARDRPNGVPKSLLMLASSTHVIRS